MLPVGEQPPGDVPADALAALDRPGALRPLFRGRDHRPVSGSVGGVPATAKNNLITSHDLDRGRAFVRIHTDDHSAHLSPPCSILLGSPGKQGTATSSRTNPS
jgi:hypothetical protein